MPAERGCAAALDGTHHLQLTEAHMTGIGATPRRPKSRKISAISRVARDNNGGGYAGVLTLSVRFAFCGADS